MIFKQFSKSIVDYYMDNILLSDSNVNILERMFGWDVGAHAFNPSPQEA